MTNNTLPAFPNATTLAELYSIAWQIEEDAVERYLMLTEQMETFNNPGLAKIFRELSRIEGLHRSQIEEEAAKLKITLNRDKVQWLIGESPESADIQQVDYMMTPRQAILLALAAEERAHAFFQHMHSQATDEQLKKATAEFVAEEAEHVQLCHKLLRQYPDDFEPHFDPDPAISQE